MGEMSYEQPPEVKVPFIRDWLTPAAREWTRAMYGGRGWFYYGCGILLLLWLFIVALKATVYGGVLALMCCAFLVTGVIDICTYRARYKSALAEAWAQRELGS